MLSLYLAYKGYHFGLIIQQLSMIFDCGFFITLNRTITAFHAFIVPCLKWLQFFVVDFNQMRQSALLVLTNALKGENVMMTP